MAFSLPIVPPPASADGQSPPTEDGSVSPKTPVSPPNNQPTALPQLSESPASSHSQSPSPGAATTQPKRKPSRRANTAERRATHNAVERQRRETLNGRFLDLAALLPNLSQIRRPSKSAIVNSSIAHNHAARRHRLLASRELRLLKLESDALRRELNEWRDRAGLPRVDEPVRGDGFTMVLNGEVEVLTAAIGEEEDEGQGPFDGFEEGDEELSGPIPTMMDDAEDIMVADPVKNGGVFGHNIAAGSTIPTDMNMVGMIPRAQPTPHGGPMIAQMPPSVSFENPAMPALYEPQINSHFSNAGHIAPHGIPTPEADKVSTWTANMYSGYNTQLPIQAQRSMMTPSNSHGVTHSPSSAATVAYTDYAYLTNLKRQQMLALQHPHGAMTYAVDGDDSSSVGSGRGGRERSGSASAGSGFGSPHGTSGSYELSNAIPDFNLARRMGTAGLHVNTAVSGSWNGRGDEGTNGMVMKQAMNSPMHIVPNGGGYSMMV
ncbi:hypothetical protein JVU11DRAFT_10917 [Chiua virens]|nr:hypothetical protein JVU11DRAFT_10917 [Chiua virens]